MTSTSEFMRTESDEHHNLSGPDVMASHASFAKMTERTMDLKTQMGQ